MVNKPETYGLISWFVRGRGRLTSHEYSLNNHGGTKKQKRWDPVPAGAPGHHENPYPLDAKTLGKQHKMPIPVVMVPPPLKWQTWNLKISLWKFGDSFWNHHVQVPMLNFRRADRKWYMIYYIIDPCCVSINMLVSYANRLKKTRNNVLIYCRILLKNAYIWMFPKIGVPPNHPF